MPDLPGEIWQKILHHRGLLMVGGFIEHHEAQFICDGYWEHVYLQEWMSMAEEDMLENVSGFWKHGEPVVPVRYLTRQEWRNSL
tara:strand:- start:547 stop:798 length:252 start_codon:yes stop_codon:yes gene_type:complete